MRAHKKEFVTVVGMEVDMTNFRTKINEQVKSKCTILSNVMVKILNCVKIRCELTSFYKTWVIRFMKKGFQVLSGPDLRMNILRK